VLLVVEDDSTFARILMDLAHQQGFKALIATRGDVALAMARKFRPNAISLDIELPDTSGWTVLDRLKHDPETRHIPVHVLSIHEDRRRGLSLGALSCAQKGDGANTLSDTFDRIQHSVERRIKSLLLIEQDEARRQSLLELIGNGDVRTTAAASGREALARTEEQEFDCVVLDPGLPDMDAGELIRRLSGRVQNPVLPVILYGTQEISREEQAAMERVGDHVVVRHVESPERLLEQTALFLHRVEATLPESKRQMLERAREVDPILAGRRVLIVDDDVRNIFALTSSLERSRIEVLHAENGRAGIEILVNTPGIDVVLMDVMMPGMDGYETTRAIRQIEAFRALPIIAVTAKAMKGDREKCLEAGASDYIPKPVDLDQLFSLLRVCLLESTGAARAAARPV
jgi:CheY-like chemotaxis protein